MPNSEFSLTAILASNRYVTAVHRGEIDALSCNVDKIFVLDTADQPQEQKPAR